MLSVENMGLLSHSLKKFLATMLPAGAIIFACSSASALNPIITVPPLDATVQLGGNVSFGVIAISIPAMTYQWLSNGIPIAGATQGSYSLSNVQLSYQATYSVEVFNGGPSTMSLSSGATLTVANVAPSITSQPQSQSQARGGTATFSVSATGTAPLSYRWTFNGVNVGGATGPSLTLSSLATSNAGSYAVVVNNSVGSITSAVASLTVVLPPTITAQPSSTSTGVGGTAAFGVTGNNATGYLWNYNGAALPGATNSTLALSGIQMSNSGSYLVVLTNIAGSVTSAVATLTVIPNFSLTSVSSPGSNVPANGFAMQFSVPAGCTYIVLASADFVNWTPIATNVASGGIVSFTDPDAKNYSHRVYRASAQ